MSKKKKGRKKRKMNINAVRGALASSKTPERLKKGLRKKFARYL